jgi:hypothetical protein
MSVSTVGIWVADDGGLRILYYQYQSNDGEETSCCNNIISEQSLYRAIDASVTNKNLSRSSVKDVENSLHDVHVSVDSRDMGIDGLWGCLLVPEVSFLCCMMMQSIISYHSGLTNNTSSSFQQRLVLWMEVSK